MKSDYPDRALGRTKRQPLMPFPPGDAMKVLYAKKMIVTVGVVLGCAKQDMSEVAKYLNRAYEELERINIKEQ